MNNRIGRTVLGSIFGVLIVVFMSSGLLQAEMAEFSLVPTATTTAAARPLTLADPAPQFMPRLTPRIVGDRAGFGDVAFKASLVTLCALHAGDYFLTRACLKYPNAAEANPFMKSIVKNPYVFAAVKVGFSALSVLILDKIYKKDKVLGWVMSTVINSAMSYVVFNNTSMLRQLRAGSGLN